MEAEVLLRLISQNLEVILSTLIIFSIGCLDYREGFPILKWVVKEFKNGFGLIENMREIKNR
ncbi:MAG: hypothetical protein Fur0024_1010 [Patescibacteria group bacterium]